jgi:hypothetical protein
MLKRQARGDRFAELDDKGSPADLQLNSSILCLTAGNRPVLQKMRMEDESQSQPQQQAQAKKKDESQAGKKRKVTKEPSLQRKGSRVQDQDQDQDQQQPTAKDEAPSHKDEDPTHAKDDQLTKVQFINTYYRIYHISQDKKYGCSPCVLQTSANNTLQGFDCNTSPGLGRCTGLIIHYNEYNTPIFIVYNGLVSQVTTENILIDWIPFPK